MGGVWGRRPGGRRFALGEEVRSRLNERYLTMNGRGWGYGRKEGATNDPETIEEKGGAEGLY